MALYFDVQNDCVREALEKAGLQLPPGCLWHAFQLEFMSEPSEDAESCLRLSAARYEASLLLSVGRRERLMIIACHVQGDEALRQAAALLTMLEEELLLSASLIFTPGCGDAEQLESELRRLPDASAARRLFYPEKKLFCSSGPELGRLLTDMNEERARAYLRDLFGEDIPPLSDDMWETLRGFLAGNMNVSEASRAMYLHRNTLLYRLDRMVARCGMDPRNFVDASRLQVAHLLLQFLWEKENSLS